jgi:hypothetical protein
MRRILLAFALLFGIARPAAASRVVVLADAQAGDLGSALAVALAGRGVEVTRLPPPAGSLRFDRAAAAQRAALAAIADAAVWLDLDDVCAVSADGRSFRYAPLARDRFSPRVFAAIATSLLDELLAPPDTNVHVTVDVDVSSAAPAPAQVAVIAPPPLTLDVMPPAAGPANGPILEVGPMLSPFTVGAELEILVPVSEQWRLGAIAMPNMSIDGAVSVLAGAGELRHAGTGAKHVDLGIIAGAAIVSGDSGTDPVIKLMGLRLGYTWERSHHATTVSLCPIALVTGDPGDPVLPGVWGSLRWGFAL